MYSAAQRAKNRQGVTVGVVSVRGVVPLCAATLITVVAAASTSGCSSGPHEPASGSTNTVITSTTKIAGAGVLGNQRRPDDSCAAEAARVDPGAPDPQRIVVLSADELDTLCALGLQSRIVGTVPPPGMSTATSYLGGAVHGLPGVGSRDKPDLSAIAAAKPDLILGSPAAQGVLSQLTAIAPTVLIDGAGARWEDGLRAIGAATGRVEAANDLVSGFTARAKQVGAGIDATHFQASVVEFTDSVMRVYGADNFPASVLADAGVDRPAAQRFTDKPYLEIGISDADLSGSPDFSAADGDIVYLSFASPAAKDRAPKILESTAWRKLSATHDNRVFIVNNEVWQSGQGVIAARGILDDLHWLNAPIN